MRLLYLNKQLLLKTSYYIKKRYTHTVTETTHTVTKPNNEPVSLTTTFHPNPNPTLPPESSLIDKIRENNSRLDEIISRPKIVIPEIKLDDKIQEMQPDGNQLAEEKPKPLTETISEIEHVSLITPAIVDNSAEIEACVTAIKTSTKVLAHTVTENLRKRKVNLEETEEAEKRQENLYSRIHEFVKSFGVTKSVLTISATLALGYTLYYIVRYQQIPFGGFIKGMLTGATSTPATELTSSIIGPTNNITITMPSNAAEAVQPNVIANTITHFIENLNPVTLFVIGTVIWFVKKKI